MELRNPHLEGASRGIKRSGSSSTSAQLCIKLHTINMKFIVLLSVVCLVSITLAVPASRSKRDILPGDPRYGTDYHHHHHQHHQEKHENEVQVTKAIGGYAGSFTAPSSGYGPPGHTPGTPVPSNQYFKVQQRTQEQQQQQQQQQHYHQHIQQPSRSYLEPTVKSKEPVLPSTSYGVVDGQRQSVPVNSYGARIESDDTPVTQEPQHEAHVAVEQHHEHQQTPVINLQSYQSPVVHEAKSVAPVPIYGAPVQTYQQPAIHNIETTHVFNKNAETPLSTFDSSSSISSFPSLPNFNSFSSQFENVRGFEIPDFSNSQSFEIPQVFHGYQPSSSEAFQHHHIQAQTPQFESQSVVVDSIQQQIPTVYKQPTQQPIGFNGGYVY